jgi:hypothetical protein
MNWGVVTWETLWGMVLFAIILGIAFLVVGVAITNFVPVPLLLAGLILGSFIGGTMRGAGSILKQRRQSTGARAVEPGAQIW